MKININHYLIMVKVRARVIIAKCVKKQSIIGNISSLCKESNTTAKMRTREGSTGLTSAATEVLGP